MAHAFGRNILNAFINKYPEPFENPIEILKYKNIYIKSPKELIDHYKTTYNKNPFIITEKSLALWIRQVQLKHLRDSKLTNKLKGVKDLFDLLQNNEKSLAKIYITIGGIFIELI